MADNRNLPKHGDRCRWGVVWTWDEGLQRWWHSSGSVMTHEEAIERGAEFDPSVGESAP